MYGFPKSELGNIWADEEDQFKKMAKHVLALTDSQLSILIANGQFEEVVQDEKKYRSDAFAAIHETMEALHEVGAVGKQTMREFDAACLTPVEVLSAEEIRLLRQREHISQPVVARYLNVSKNLVSD